ncbi:MAG: DUF2489 domain-containing protein [Pseudomonadales bacterium]|jgi:hypothetical protein|nr:DUF2489 domain-containing protein [Pseudomonadales bacterium]
MSATDIAIVAALALLLVLAAVLARLLLRLRSRAASRRDAGRALARHNQDAHEQRLKSLEMITLATLAGDCELSEGCLRVRALLRDYPGLRSAPEHAAIEALYEDIRDLAIGDVRRRLPTAALERQDEVRRAVEGRHRGAVLASFRVLREQARELAGSPYDVDLATGARTGRSAETTPPG